MTTHSSAGSAGTSAQPIGDLATTENVASSYVSPHVVYTDEARTLRLVGSHLKSRSGQAVLLDGTMLAAFEPSSDNEAHVMLPMLAAGEHTLKIGEDGESLRVVSVARVRFEDAIIELPGQVQQVIFDDERNVFFCLLTDPNNQYSLVRIRFDGTTWKVEPIEVPSPHMISLTENERELLVITAGCVMVHVSPDSLARLAIHDLGGCDMFTNQLFVFANGQTLISGMSSRAWLQPDGMTITLPFSSSSVAVMGQYRTRLLWADSSQGSTQVFKYDAADADFTPFRTLSGDGFRGDNLALSGDGERMAHGADIYDRTFSYLGSLESNHETEAVGVSGNAAVAVAYNTIKETVQAYDVTGIQSPFPKRGPEIALPWMMFGRPHKPLVLDEAGQTLFAFTYGYITDGSTPIYRFIVRRLADH